jgi:hypothetical protein
MLDSILMSLVPGDLCTEYDVVQVFSKGPEQSQVKQRMYANQGKCAPSCYGITRHLHIRPSDALFLCQTLPKAVKPYFVLETERSEAVSNACSQKS